MKTTTMIISQDPDPNNDTITKSNIGTVHLYTVGKIYYTNIFVFSEKSCHYRDFRTETGLE